MSTHLPPAPRGRGAAAILACARGRRQRRSGVSPACTKPIPAASPAKRQPGHGRARTCAGALRTSFTPRRARPP